MLEIHERVQSSEWTVTLTLPFQERQRSRARVTLSTGEEAALLLPRGSVLRGGDVLALSDGRRVRVQAALETVSTVRSAEATLLLRAAYHLGNRHVPVQIGDGLLRYGHDHVLDGMVRELGLSVVVEAAEFEPEAGAFAREPHPHPHSHTHSHSHSHSHSHESRELGHGHEGAHEHLRERR